VNAPLARSTGVAGRALWCWNHGPDRVPSLCGPGPAWRGSRPIALAILTSRSTSRAFSGEFRAIVVEPDCCSSRPTLNATAHGDGKPIMAN